MASDQSKSPISPTAHYTGTVWSRNGLSHPSLSTRTGQLMFHGMRPWMMVSKAIGGPTLEEFLLARHRLIDDSLAAAIDAGEMGQVIEIASGLSPRGWRFSERFGDEITYLETDLPAMVERKREALAEAGSLDASHRVVELDALSDAGEHSLAAVAAELDPDRGVAIITEGLLSYLDRPSVEALWRRVAATLSGFPHGLYLSDLHLASENSGFAAEAFIWMLSVFVRGKVEMHFEDVAEASAELEAAGFVDPVLHRGDEVADGVGTRSVRVIEARTPPRA